VQDSRKLAADRGGAALIALALAACAAATPPAQPAPPVPAVAAGPAAAAPSAGADRAELLVAQAADDYRNAQFAVAIARAQQAQAVLAARRRSSPEESDRTLGARAAFITGCSLAAFGANEQAIAAFSRVRAFDPQFEPPQGWLSPRLEKLYLAAQNP